MLFITCLNNMIASSALARLLFSENENGEIAINVIEGPSGISADDIVNCDSYVGLMQLLAMAVVVSGDSLALQIKKL